MIALVYKLRVTVDPHCVIALVDKLRVFGATRLVLRWAHTVCLP